MEVRNLKPLIIAVSTAFAALIYTKKRIRKSNRLKTVHSKAGDREQGFVKKG